MAKRFVDLTEREILALAVSLEEEDERIYGDVAEGLRADLPATAAVFDGMRRQESEHRRQLIELYRRRFGEHIPLIRRQDVKGFVQRRPIWLARPLRVDAVRELAGVMEAEARRFYERAATSTTDAGTRQLLNDLAQEERFHEHEAERLRENELDPDAQREEEEARRRLLVLQIVQPSLAGLMDGSVSTLAPVFATAFATRNTWDAFLVGLAASVGAGISMGFAEALSDDGSMTGRGLPWVRGLVCGLMTALGGVGHTVPYLMHDFRIATGIAIAVVLLELGVITWLRHRYMDTRVWSAAFQVAIGGAIVFATGVLIGSW